MLDAHMLDVVPQHRLPSIHIQVSLDLLDKIESITNGTTK